MALSAEPKGYPGDGHLSVPPIEVHSDLRIADLYWLFFSSGIRKLIYARWVLAVVLIFLVALGTQYVAFIALLLLPPFLYLVLGGLVFVAVVLPYIRSRAFVRATMGPSGTLSCAIGPAGVDVRRRDSQVHYDWGAVRGAKQTSSLILIYVNGHAALVLPKRCFANSQQLKDVRSIVAAHTKSRLKKRDYWP
jgi:hypothetical protein